MPAHLQRTRCNPATKTLALLAITAFAIVSCDEVQSPTAPVGETTQGQTRLAALGSDGAAVTIPVRLEATVVSNVDQSASALSACPGTPGIAVGEGSGTGTYLGTVTITKFDHCSIDLRPPVGPEDLRRRGEFIFEAADGSALSGTYAFLFLPAEQGGFFSMQIEDGTRRFAGASGELEFVDGEVTVCDDALCLDNAVFKPILAGTLTLPRP